MIILLGMLIIVACQMLAPKARVASPLILLAVGLGIGFLPTVSAIEVPPEVILEMILPPLLFSAAVRMPTMDFRREMTAVAALAIPLVVISAVAVGFLVNWMVPQISLPWGIALGAVLSPTDAVAVTIAKNSGVSHRIITVLEGEGLFNDASALVLLSAAMSAGMASDEHALDPGNLIWKFVIALVVAIVIGWIVGEIGVRVRARIKDSATDTVFSFAMPFLASIPAEHLGGSGLVAAVVAGLVVSRHGTELISANNRRFSRQNWTTLTLVLESGIFLAMGLQAFGVIEDASEAEGGVGTAVLLALIAGGLIMLIRTLFITGMLVVLDRRNQRHQQRLGRDEERLRDMEERLTRISAMTEEDLFTRNLNPKRLSLWVRRWNRRLERSEHRQRLRSSDLDYFENEPLGAREGSIIVWAGMRGAITLAAAQTISSSAPMRGFLLLVALFVASGALVVQGISLPGVIRLVKPKMAEGDVSEEERLRLAKVMGSALVDTALAQAIHEVDGHTLLSAGVSRTLSRIDHALEEQENTEGKETKTADRILDDVLSQNESATEMQENESPFTRAQIRALALEAIHAQRGALLDARDEGVFSSVALERALHRLDNEEILLVSGPFDEQDEEKFSSTVLREAEKDSN